MKLTQCEHNTPYPSTGIVYFLLLATNSAPLL